MSCGVAGAAERTALLLDGRTGADRSLLGGKAASIERLRALGLSVPPAFVLTTEVCGRFLAESQEVPEDVWDRVPTLMHALEQATERTFGAGPRPLLVSVRSGAAISMPGMMDTVLNLGMTEHVEQALADGSGDPGYAADTRRRFDEQFEKVVGRPVPEEPYEQLRLAIGAVFESWSSPRAVAYRRDRGIPDDGGTAVTVQAMVFGNLDDRSGTGVMFTRDPLTGDAEAYGEWLVRGQGEDVVSGRSDARPLAELARDMPEVYRELMAAARLLEADARDVQDIEFTVQAGRLWLLQTRDAKRSPEAAVRHAVAMVRDGLISREEALSRVTPEQIEALRHPRLDPTRAASATVLARGKPASPGVGTGMVTTDVDEVEEQADDAVLVRPTTAPEDVPAMSVVSAVVTEYGGSTSHAAVVCRELAVPCVVGCGSGTVAALAGRVVTVDGSTGTIYDGPLPVLAAGLLDDPDLATLAEWARADSQQLPTAGLDTGPQADST
ncbi:pyruvate, phosphate dikinase [Saccharopolyspora sp. 5N102]|uniref:pyruvate, phosphate dikinase n=1 Tax=Saccharopolyspora sp. 5N102 TaxID=3375155 RepID=UPI0037B595ED